MAAVVLCPPIIYLLSFGPICWLVAGMSEPVVPKLYSPISWLIQHAPEPAANVLRHYALFGVSGRPRFVFVPGISETHGDLLICDLPNDPHPDRTIRLTRLASASPAD